MSTTFSEMVFQFHDLPDLIFSKGLFKTAAQQLEFQTYLHASVQIAWRIRSVLSGVPKIDPLYVKDAQDVFLKCTDQTKYFDPLNPPTTHLYPSAFYCTLCTTYLSISRILTDASKLLPTPALFEHWLLKHAKK